MRQRKRRKETKEEKEIHGEYIEGVELKQRAKKEQYLTSTLIFLSARTINFIAQKNIPTGSRQVNNKNQLKKTTKVSLDKRNMKEKINIITLMKKEKHSHRNGVNIIIQCPNESQYNNSMVRRRKRTYQWDQGKYITKTS